MIDDPNNDESGPAALVIQPGAVGDVLLTLPLVRLLKAEYGYKRVDLAGHLERLTYLVGKTAIDRVLSLDSCSLHSLFLEPESLHLSEDDPLIELFRPYALIVTFLADAQGHFEANLIMTAIRTHPVEVGTLGLRPPEDFRGHAAEFFIGQFAEQMIQKPLQPAGRYLRGPLLETSPAIRKKGADLLAGMGLEPNRVITLQPSSGGEGKCWPAENFCALAAKLRQKDIQPLFLLGPVEMERWAVDDIAKLEGEGQIVQGLNLEQVGQLLSASSGYIGNDSGISHLAGALDIPVLVIFGPTNPEHWRPLGKRIMVCRSDRPVIPWPSVDEVFFRFDDLQLRS